MIVGCPILSLTLDLASLDRQTKPSYMFVHQTEPNQTNHSLANHINHMFVHQTKPNQPYVTHQTRPSHMLKELQITQLYRGTSAITDLSFEDIRQLKVEFSSLQESRIRLVFTNIEQTILSGEIDERWVRIGQRQLTYRKILKFSFLAWNSLFISLLQTFKDWNVLLQTFKDWNVMLQTFKDWNVLLQFFKDWNVMLQTFKDWNVLLQTF